MRILEERKNYILRYSQAPCDWFGKSSNKKRIHVSIEGENNQGEMEIWYDVTVSTNLEKTLKKSSKKLITYFEKGFK